MQNHLRARLCSCTRAISAPACDMSTRHVSTCPADTTGLLCLAVPDQPSATGLPALRATLDRELVLMSRTFFVYIFKAVQARPTALCRAPHPEAAEA